MNKIWIITPQPEHLLNRLPPSSMALPITSQLWAELILRGEEERNGIIVLPPLNSSLSTAKTEGIFSNTKSFLERGGSVVFLEKTIVPFLPLFDDGFAYPIVLDLQQAPIAIHHPNLVSQFGASTAVNSPEPVLSLRSTHSQVNNWISLGDRGATESLMLSLPYQNGFIYHCAVPNMVIHGKPVALADFILSQAFFHTLPDELDQKLRSARGKLGFQTTTLLQPGVPFELELGISAAEHFWLGIDGFPNNELRIIAENAEKTALLDETRQNLPFIWSTIRAGSNWKIRLNTETVPLFCRLLLAATPAAWKWKSPQF